MMQRLSMVRLVGALCTGILCLSAPLGAQETLFDEAEAPRPPSLLAGVGATVGAGMISTTIPYYALDPTCGSFVDATAMPISLEASLRLPRLLTAQIGAGLRLGFTTQSASMKGEPVDPQRQVDPETGTLVEVDRELRLDAGSSVLHADLLAGVSIGDFSFWVGPSLGLRIGGETTVSDAIIGPEFARFRDGSRERPMAGATTLERAGAGIGAVADAAYAIGLSPKLTLSPHLRVRIEPATAYEGIEWSQTTLGGGLTLLFDLTPSPTPIAATPEPEPIAIPEPVREPVRQPVTVPVAPTAEVALRSLDSNGQLTLEEAEVVYRELIERRHVPIIPAVFFDSASASLPARIVRYGTESKPTDIARELAGASTMESQASVLNILGERLRANPRQRVTLIGSVSTGEDRELATARARAVRDYLVSVWRLESSQVEISNDRRLVRLSNEANPEGREENRRVHLIASSPELLRPLFVERTMEIAVEPLRVRLEATASIPAESWSIAVRDGSRELVRIDTTSADVIRRDLVITPEKLSTETTTLTATANATFADARGATARGSVGVIWRREKTFVEGGTELVAERERTTWQVLGFPYNSPELLDRHRDEIATIAGLVRSGAHVVVTGYSDRLGDEKRNLTLSRQRAESVAAALRAELGRRGRGEVTVDAVGSGVDETRFSNDLPEGRFLSRGVTIFVEQSSH